MTVGEDIKAFLRDISQSCASCFQRGLGYCELCIATRAKRLLATLSYSANGNSPQPPTLELNYIERYARVIEIIRRSRRPLAAREININGFCSKGLKYWTLRRLVQIGRLEMSYNGNEYLFSIPRQKKGTIPNEPAKEISAG